MENNIHLNPIGEPAHRLSLETRELAATYLTGGFHSRLKPAGFRLSSSANLPPLTVRAELAKLTAEKSSLEIVPAERFAGAAPNLEALRHFVPGLDKVSSISHTTVDFCDAVRKGLAGLQKEVESNRENADAEQKLFCDALLTVIDSVRIWVRRYVSELTERAASEERYTVRMLHVRDLLTRVPENPPETFEEALQSFWIFFEFQRLCGNWSGLGRFDLFLGDYLKRDLAEGILTLDEARELLAHFWIKGTEWCCGLRKFNPDDIPEGGDAQVYQNIILGGTAPDGSQVENEVTYLVLDVIEELHISDYPVTVRLNSKTSDSLLKRIAELQLLGGGIVSVYNEEVVMAGLKRFGFPDDEVATFTNDGCWETLIPGQTQFGYTPFDALTVFQDALFAEKTPESYEELYSNWLLRLEKRISELRGYIRNLYYTETVNPDGTVSLKQKSQGDDVTLSLMMPSCRKSMRSYQNFGAKYTVKAFHAGGLPDVANSLYAIRKLVFQEKRFPLAELVEFLRNDWAGREPLRREILHTLPCYGNDNEEADSVLRRVFRDYAEIAGREKRILDVLTPVGVSTFGREISFAKRRAATAFGKHAGEFLAPNLSPTPGTEKESLTAVLNSYCKMEFELTPNGCPLDLRLSAGIRNVPDAAGILAAILRVFLKKRGFYLQIDTVNPEILKAAQQDPDRYPNLVVRISGWSARFASLPKVWQDMIINRTALEAV